MLVNNTFDCMELAVVLFAYTMFLVLIYWLQKTAGKKAVKRHIKSQAAAPPLTGPAATIVARRARKYSDL